MPPKPKLYTLSTCMHCRNCKEFLKENDVEFEYVDVDKTYGKEREQLIEEVKRYNKDLSFPTIIIGDKIIVGFKKEELKEALGL